jgi:hypothetical protein
MLIADIRANFKAVIVLFVVVLALSALSNSADIVAEASKCASLVVSFDPTNNSIIVGMID